jgi:type IV pilus assembly protein PilY1
MQAILETRRPAARLRLAQFATTAVVACLVLVGALSPTGARADDTEIFFSPLVAGASGQPNIMFILDTSGSMGTNVTTQIPFDPTKTYSGGTASSGSCDPNKVYWVAATAKTPPKCNTSQLVDKNQFQCRTAYTALGLDKIDAVLTTGKATFIAAQWNSKVNSGKNPSQWEGMSVSTRSDNWVDCQPDAQLTPPDGGTDSRSPYEANGTNGPYSSDKTKQISWTANPPYTVSTTPKIGSYTFYSANYLHWYWNASSITQTRLQIVQQVAKSTIAGLGGVNVGLMRYSSDGNGGMVLNPVVPLTDANRLTLNTQIDSMSPNGSTPLETTLYEAALYFRGNNVDYGNKSVPVKSVDSSRTTPGGGQYLSPLQSDCQKNFIVFLTDGLPNVDYSAESKILALPGFKSTIGSTCGPNVPVDGTQSGTNLTSGRCFAPLAEYLYKTDQSSSVGGLQNITLYTIGFGPDVAGSTTLADAARRGGGQYFPASDTATLSDALEQIVRQILTQNTFFTAPTISVNAFNRTRNLNDLFITMFQSAGTYHWPGNLKKYRLRANGDIVDSRGDPAVDAASGFFRMGARSFWLDAAAPDDGPDVLAGGAANVLPTPAQRKVYTDLSLGDLTVAGNTIATTNAALTPAMFGLAATDTANLSRMINFTLGADIDASPPSTPRYEMGDPLHAQPVSVIYGGTTAVPNIDDGVVIVATNDGYLHMFDPTTGQELWSFVPQTVLPRMYQLYQNATLLSKSYGLDGSLRVYKLDKNNDGIVDPAAGDRVYLVFGMGRGGSYYYALDITDKNVPKLMWRVGPNELPGVGQTWSAASITRVNVSGATQNTEKLVAIVGGGYDPLQDSVAYSTNSIGNRIYMLDLLTGTLLWRAGPNSALYGLDAGAQLKLDKMNNAIPADIRVIDLNADGYADRMYATDTGGRIWRFDIFNGQPAATLVTGGVFASLGMADGVGTSPTDARRFYYAPDASILRQDGRTFINLAVGSGFRGSPLNTQIQDRFYSLRDYQPFAQLTQAAYGLNGWNSTTMIYDNSSGIVDATGNDSPTLTNTSLGWKMNLISSNTWVGEKALAEARTFGGEVFFTTYTPNGAAVAQCTVSQGTNRLYVVNALTGGIVNNRDTKSVDLPSSGIASNVVFVFPSPDNPADPNSNAPFTCTTPGKECRPDPVCLAGLNNCGTIPVPGPVRTFWTQRGVDD